MAHQMRLLGCFLLALVLLGCGISEAQNASSNIPDEDWGYVEARDGAHMFWWLYGAKDVAARPNLPLIIWLQGGPGGSGTGFGNFKELGPINIDGSAREDTWINAGNVLFIDNPVGTGFSYVDDVTLLSTTNEQISLDLVEVYKGFLKIHPEFNSVPLYIFCESYGGKMTTGFANALLAASSAGEVPPTLKAVALGDSWISPMDFVWEWGPLLHYSSLVDDSQLAALQAQAKVTQNLCDQGLWSNATDSWGVVETLVEEFSDNVDFYNTALHNVADDAANDDTTEGAAAAAAGTASYLRAVAPENLAGYMNNEVRAKLGVIPKDVTWGGQSGDVFSALSGDFMRPVVNGEGSVAALLAAGVQVNVYSGQLDLICATEGTERWMRGLDFDGLTGFQAANKTAFYIDGDARNTAGFVKEHQNLRMYYIMQAGHMVPADQPAAALKMVKEIVA